MSPTLTFMKSASDEPLEPADFCAWADAMNAKGLSRPKAAAAAAAAQRTTSGVAGKQQLVADHRVVMRQAHSRSRSTVKPRDRVEGNPQIIKHPTEKIASHAPCVAIALVAHGAGDGA